MKFSIITPTHKRVDKLTRAVDSVLQQEYSNWEMIIVNDSPEDASYTNFASSITDRRIKYFNNDKNRGVNYTRNFALDSISDDSDWVVFLDDDDYIAKDALTALSKILSTHPHVNWLVTNRAYADGTLVTQFPKNNSWYSYTRDCLILKRCRGDVTHTIKTSTIKNIRFSKEIKQAEEWIFYYQLGLHEKMFYHNHNSTITDGYDEVSGLNFRKRSAEEQLHTIRVFITEGKKLAILYHLSFVLYLCMRLVRILIRR